MKSMKMDDIIQKLYVGLDIHEDYITGTAMREDGAIEFSGNFKNTKEAAQCFLSGVPSPQVKIAIEACGLWRPRKLIKYAGLCPGIYQLGSKSYPVRDKACNKYLKWIMYECSGRVIMNHTKYQKHYWRVCRRKDKQVARRSAARRMLTDVRFILKYEKSYNSITNQ